ncbi:MAG: cytochrome c5 family protein [Chlorobiaceae bacterium]|nr:cytochrome c5 family protein [Chlorobiaceae bacterium]NTW10965.1 cytochrome c5 family protein [Chlorobiaceae bacterium]
MTKKSVLPLLTVSCLFLGACGLEKPPASLKFPEAKNEGAAPAAAAPAAPAAETPADPKLAAGKTVYDTSCAGCHDAGMMGAPKPGDKANWAPRLAKGIDVVNSNAVKGFTGKAGMMPAKGGNASLTDEQVIDATAYMVDKSK